MGGIVTLAFEVDTAGCCGCGGWIPSGVYGGSGGCGGLFGAFPTIFVLYLNDLPSKALSSTSSVLSL